MFELFETLVIQPIFNLLLVLHSAVGDFGVAIILFTVLIRLLMWPLLRKQLHHGRAMRKLQPEIKKIRDKHKGDPPAQSAALRELYKEHEVSPLGSFGLLFIQLPVFIGLFTALRSTIDNPERTVRLPYDFVAESEDAKMMLESLSAKTNEAIASLEDQGVAQSITERFGGEVTPEALSALPKEELISLYNNELVRTVDGSVETLVHGPFFEQQLFGVIDLSGQAFGDGPIYIPVLIIAILAGVFQYLQTRQLIPKAKDAKTVRQIMAEAAKEGKEPDQGELSAAMNSKMGAIFAPLITLISATSPSGLALYFASSGLVGLLQQRTVLNEDVEEMELVADVSEAAEKKKSTPKKSNNNAPKGNNKNKKKSSSKKKSGKRKGS